MIIDTVAKSIVQQIKMTYCVPQHLTVNPTTNDIYTTTMNTAYTGISMMVYVK